MRIRASRRQRGRCPGSHLLHDMLDHSSTETLPPCVAANPHKLDVQVGPLKAGWVGTLVICGLLAHELQHSHSMSAVDATL